MRRICKNCEYYVPNGGRYGSGICVSEKSRKQNKDFVLKLDTCKEFIHRRKNEEN